MASKHGPDDRLGEAAVASGRGDLRLKHRLGEGEPEADHAPPVVLREALEAVAPARGDAAVRCRLAAGVGRRGIRGAQAVERPRLVGAAEGEEPQERRAPYALHPHLGRVYYELGGPGASATSAPRAVRRL